MPQAVLFTEPSSSQTLTGKKEGLDGILLGLGRVLVCFSGGIDSSYLLWRAKNVLGKANVLGLTGSSESLPSQERQKIAAWAAWAGVRHEWIDTQEFDNPAYISNPANRCYFCKDDLYAGAAEIAQKEKMIVVDGSNFSDLTDERPGYQAAKKWNVRHPLEEAGLAKTDIVALAKLEELPNWNKPASPCLSSRIPHGQTISAEALDKVNRAEEYLKTQGLRIVRVRHLSSDTAKIETSAGGLEIAAAKAGCIKHSLAQLGFNRVWVDLKARDN